MFRPLSDLSAEMYLMYTTLCTVPYLCSDTQLVVLYIQRTVRVYFVICAERQR